MRIFRQWNVPACTAVLPVALFHTMLGLGGDWLANNFSVELGCESRCFHNFPADPKNWIKKSVPNISGGTNGGASEHRKL